ncbi:MAG: hypothetical protein J0M29_12265 [Chitinophagales bacterium]|nr:hypothetical protein [Chitinophagales bacterium]
MQHELKRFLGGMVILAVLAAALYVPMTLPYASESIGRVLPVQEWRLVQDQTGRLTSIIRDHKTGTAQQIDAFQFEQGDFSGIKIDIPTGSFVSAGDTVVRMYSIRQREEIQQIEAQLTLYGAQLQSDITGDKPPIVEEAENKLHFAEQDLKLKEDFYHLKKKLKGEGLIAATEFQIAENEWNLAKIQVEIARKYLENVTTGLKTETVGVTQAQLQGLKNRLQILKQKGLSFVIRAPFSGWVTSSALPEELLTLQRADEYVVKIPVRVEQLRHLHKDIGISVRDVQSGHIFQGKYGSLGTKVEVLDNRQVSILTAFVQPDSTGARLSTGVSTLCRLDFGKVNQREYLRRILNFQP